MKVIPTDRVDTITATSENANFPATNMQDEHPKRVWKAVDGVAATTWVIETSGNINAIIIANTNADIITVDVEDLNAFAFGGETTGTPADEFGGATSTSDPDVIASEDVPSSTITVASGQSSNAIWVDFSESYTGALKITIQLTNYAGNTLYAGILRAGETPVLNNPDYGLNEGMIDFSISSKLSNGARYYKLRDIVRVFDGQIVLERSSSNRRFYTFMDDVYRANGSQPLGWQIINDNSEFIVFGFLDGPPTGSHTFLSHSTVNFTIEEAL